MICAAVTSAICDRPASKSGQISELICGEGFTVQSIKDEWVEGVSDHDSYHGFVRRQDLIECDYRPNHRIAHSLALIFQNADIKSPCLGRLPFGAMVCLGERQGDFVALRSPIATGFIHDRHLLRHPDHVWPAQTLIGTPYLWGGRSSLGLDCSGLVQICLLACGVMNCPRDSMPQKEWSESRDIQYNARAKGDLVFFPGHVGIMVDATQVVHANAFFMQVTQEPLSDLLNRLELDQPIAVRRI